MTRCLSLLIVACLLAALPWLTASAQGEVGSTAMPGKVLQLTVDGAISPATAAHVTQGLELAQDGEYRAVVLQLDTPGGLMTSMRDIVKSILASQVPVIGYVSPAGARAASAGTYILYACHVAAMAPATHLGAATPVPISGSMPIPGPAAAATTTQPHSAEARKQVNDAVAYIRSLAKQRGRNADWAEQAVRGAASLTAAEALDSNVIDVVAPDIDSLLAAVDGRRVDVAGKLQSLRTKSATLVEHEAGWRSRFLAVVANPSLAYLLLMIGIFGLLLEGYHPGAVVPGVVGAISLLLALYGFQLLPVNFAGLALILLGVVLIIAEAFVPSFGALGLGGVISFVVGSVVLMDTDVPGFGLSIPLVVTFSLVAALLVAGIVWLAMRSVRRPQVSGSEEMIGLVGKVLSVQEDVAWIRIHGESWQAISSSPLHKDQRVRVLTMDGLQLNVEPIPGSETN